MATFSLAPNRRPHGGSSGMNRPVDANVAFAVLARMF